MNLAGEGHGRIARGGQADRVKQRVFHVQASQRRDALWAFIYVAFYVRALGLTEVSRHEILESTTVVTGRHDPSPIFRYERCRAIQTVNPDQFPKNILEVGNETGGLE